MGDLTMYKNLVAELARYGISRNAVCKLLNVSASTLRYKINRYRTDFTISEMRLVYDTYFKDDPNISFEYLSTIS